MIRAMPAGAWVCALVAVLNGAAWSVIVPPFQAIDEPAHFAYVQELAESGRLPSSSGSEYSPAEELALQDTHFDAIHRDPQVPAILSPAEHRRLSDDLADPPSEQGIRDAGTAASEPPLYYAVASVAYDLGRSGTLLDRLELVRLLSALMAGFTALFVFLFVRESLPSFPWTWPAGGLAVAFSPLLGYMSGVNPDAMLFSVCAALFYCLARAFRRGITPRLGALIGGLVAVGFLTKLNFLGVIPGVVLAELLLTWRAARVSRPIAYRSLACATAAAAVPILVYVLINVASGRPAVYPASAPVHVTVAKGSVLGAVSYMWQFYLPRLPGMHRYFPGLVTVRDIWFNRAVARYGWLETAFPDWVYRAGLVPGVLVVLLLLRGLLLSRASVRRHASELLVYSAIGVGVLTLVGISSYIGYLTEGDQFGEPRYLLPMAALLGLIFALATRGAGRRWGPAVGTLLVLVIVAQDVFSQLLVVSRYYG